MLALGGIHVWTRRTECGCGGGYIAQVWATEAGETYDHCSLLDHLKDPWIPEALTVCSVVERLKKSDLDEPLDGITGSLVRLSVSVLDR